MFSVSYLAFALLGSLFLVAVFLLGLAALQATRQRDEAEKRLGQLQITLVQSGLAKWITLPTGARHLVVDGTQKTRIHRATSREKRVR